MGGVLPCPFFVLNHQQMSLNIKTFTADATSMVIIVDSTAALTEASMIPTDGVLVDILADFISSGTDEYTATLLGDYSDGVFTADVTNADTTNDTATIGNLLLGTLCLLKSTIMENYDCVLFQQLEAVKQLLLGDNGDLAQSIYFTIQIKCTPCIASDGEVVINPVLEGISIWIIDDNFIVQ